MNIAVIGTPEHEGVICGDAFQILDISPTWYRPGDINISPNEKPDAVIVSREWETDIRLSVLEFRRKGVPVIYVMDGVIEWAYVWNNQSFVIPRGTMLQPLIASHLCVIGRHPARILSSLGLGGRISIVGLPRLDGVERKRCQTAGTKPKLVIATAKTYSHNLEHRIAVKRALRDLKLFFDEHLWIEPVWRISPELADELQICPQPKGTMSEVLRDAAGLLSFTSTSLLEGMLVGVPTAQIDYRSVPIFVQTAWEIRCADHIESVIQEILYPTNSKMAYQEYCLEDELECGPASQRLAHVVEKALDNETVPDEYTQATLPDARLDYRQLHSHLSAFSLPSKAILQYELDAFSKELLKTKDCLKEARQSLEETQGRLHRIVNHVILGFIIHAWARLINRNVLDKS
ncbi:MAG: hypothetical protein C1943_03300 [Halochromatium sp.]|nr:hypothetical protein [Halochromatium sp.]